LPTSDEAAHLLGGELVDLNVVDESVAGTHHQSGLQIYASLSSSEDDGDVNRNYQQHPHIHNGHTERRSYDTHSLFSLLHKNIHLVLAYSIAALVAFIAIYHHYVPSSPNQHHHEAEPSEVANLPYFDLAYSLITNDPLSYKTPSDLGIPLDRHAGGHRLAYHYPLTNGTSIYWWVSMRHQVPIMHMRILQARRIECILFRTS
jgi:hypothetical protein